MNARVHCRPNMVDAGTHLSLGHLGALVLELHVGDGFRCCVTHGQHFGRRGEPKRYIRVGLAARGERTQFVLRDDEAAADGIINPGQHDGVAIGERLKCHRVGVTGQCRTVIKNDILGGIERNWVGAAKHQQVGVSDAGDQAGDGIGINIIGPGTKKAQDNGAIRGMAFAGKRQRTMQPDRDAGRAFK